MDIFLRMAEERIKEAFAKGEFENLPGKGKPIVFEDETWIPDDRKLAYKILKNAGCVPPEVEARKEIHSLKALISAIDDEKERTKRLLELDFKLMKFNLMTKRPFNLDEFPEYKERVVEKLTK